MRLDELEPYCRELLALHSILMSLGFKPEDLFVSQSDFGTNVSIKKNDNFYNFQATNEPTKKANSEFVADWTAATTTWNTSTTEEKTNLVNSSTIRKYAGGILTILIREELLPPQTANISCPFCAGKVHVALSTKEYFVSHSLPFCEKFYESKPHEFLKQINHTIN